MSERNVYSIRDVKAGEYLGLVLFRTEYEAHRFFLMTITDKRGPMYKFPKDYQIFQVGLFDNETGILVRSEVPKDVTPHSAVDSFLAFAEKLDKAMEGVNRG